MYEFLCLYGMKSVLSILRHEVDQLLNLGRSRVVLPVLCLARDPWILLEVFCICSVVAILYGCFCCDCDIHVEGLVDVCQTITILPECLLQVLDTSIKTSHICDLSQRDQCRQNYLSIQTPIQCTNKNG